MKTLAFKVALDPTPVQVQLFSSHIGAARFAYNWSLNEVSLNWAQVKEDPTIGYINVTGYGLRKKLNSVKEDVAPWWKENSKEAFASGTSNAAKALQNWFKSRKNLLSAKKVGFPKYKTRHDDSQLGVTFTTGSRWLDQDNKHFVLPRIGRVRLLERLTQVRGLLKRGGSIGSVVLSNSHNRYWLAINIQVSEEVAYQYFQQRHRRKNSKVSGLDLGLKVFLVNDEGVTVENPAFLKNSIAKLRKSSKRLSRRRAFNKRTGEVASKRWERAHRQLVRSQGKIRNQRQDFLQKLSTSIVLETSFIGIENLNISGMIKNKKLSRSIADVGWGEFKRQLKYKSEWYGTIIQEVDRFYPSSKTCSNCGEVKAKLLLSERIFECDRCGLVLDRDHNAAKNIKRKAFDMHKHKVAPSCEETLNGRGGDSAGSVTIMSETIAYEASSRTQVLQSQKDEFY